MSREITELLIEIVDMLRSYNLSHEDIQKLEGNVRRIVELVRNYDTIIERKL